VPTLAGTSLADVAAMSRAAGVPLVPVTYPNDQTSEYGYLSHEADHRLETILHKYPSGATLSKFDYTYDAVGNIPTWRQQADRSAVLWKYGYDGASSGGLHASVFLDREADGPAMGREAPWSTRALARTLSTVFQSHPSVPNARTRGSEQHSALA
jgi:hypothetical protein